MPNIKMKIINYILIVGCFLMMIGCSDSSYIKRSQCLPPTFPTTESLNPYQERYLKVDVDKSIQEVSEYYIELLEPSTEYPINTWSMVELKGIEAGIIQFVCYGSLDSFADETGCILLHIKGEGETTIEYIWNLSEIATGCYSQLITYK